MLERVVVVHARRHAGDVGGHEVQLERKEVARGAGGPEEHPAAVPLDVADHAGGVEEQPREHAGVERFLRRCRRAREDRRRRAARERRLARERDRGDAGIALQLRRTRLAHRAGPSAELAGIVGRHEAGPVRRQAVQLAGGVGPVHCSISRLRRAETLKAGGFAPPRSLAYGQRHAQGWRVRSSRRSRSSLIVMRRSRSSLGPYSVARLHHHEEHDREDDDAEGDADHPTARGKTRELFAPRPDASRTRIWRRSVGVYTARPKMIATAQSAMRPAIRAVVNGTPEMSTFRAPVRKSRPYAGFAARSSRILMPRRTWPRCSGSRAARASQIPYEALKPTAMIARTTWTNLTYG